MQRHEASSSSSHRSYFITTHLNTLAFLNENKMNIKYKTHKHSKQKYILRLYNYVINPLVKKLSCRKGKLSRLG